ncbi:MAG: asparaginase [Bacteriovoracaceae bacterium]|nr:asparaginase [Bacteriovoracaceae bacterium]
MAQSQGFNENFMALNDTRPLIILTTGGTIEKNYDESEGTLQNRNTMVENKILKKLRLPYTKVSVEFLMAKDSLVMDEHDRELICQKIQELSQQGAPIVVIHGTDTMDITASYCFENAPNISVPVIFTGAMKPVGFDDSDAAQNVIEAVMVAHLIKPGYWASFHSRLFEVPHFRKNRQKGTFEAFE